MIIGAFGSSANSLPSPISSVTVGASPFSHIANSAGHIAVTGGTVSSISLKRGGTTIATGLIAGVFVEGIGDTITVTYTAAPTMNFVPG